MEPPIMAPVLLTPPEEDASGASVTGSPEAVEDSAAAEVEDESSVDVEDDAELDALLLDEVSVDDAVDVVWLPLETDPSVVGSDSWLGVAVRGAETVSSAGRAVTPEAVATTVAAMSEAEPQPYWKFPPSKVFL